MGRTYLTSTTVLLWQTRYTFRYKLGLYLISLSYKSVLSGLNKNLYGYRSYYRERLRPVLALPRCSAFGFQTGLQHGLKHKSQETYCQTKETS